jgi:phosphoribosylglycinamide formyltransferase
MDTKKKNIAVFASGSGTNFEAIVTACRNGTIASADVALLVCDHHDAFAVERAKRFGVKYFIFDRKAYDSKQEYETAVLEALRPYHIDLICLAGYMRIVGQTLLEAYPKRILNIHPALLPSFKGATAIIDAFEYGVKVFGVTVHLIDNTVDGGVIISQRAFEYDGDSLEEVERRIHGIEHVLYPEAINRVLSKYE